MDFDESLAQLQQLLLKHDEGQGNRCYLATAIPGLLVECAQPIPSPANMARGLR